MNQKNISIITLLLAVLALGLQIESRAQFDKRVSKIVEERERKYCAELAVKLNQSRELVGLQPVSPNNFAEVLNSYFESMASVMDEGISKSSPDNKPTVK